MARPQQPELARSGKTDIDPDHIETGLQGQPAPATGGDTGPIPADNQPGHHPAHEQDKPDLDAFAAKLGADPKAPTATKARKPARPKTATAKAGASKSTPAKPGAKNVSGPATRPAPTGERESPSAPPRIETTPAKRPAGAPAWPESAPAADDLGPLPDATGSSGPQPQQEQEPFMVALAMLPLRETVKRLERLEQTLSKRLMAKAGRGPNGR
jgi:hypothetical protein